ncbi:hypothetical protein GCM10027051_20100 [Niabella terrae]
MLKRIIAIWLLVLTGFSAMAQCSICTKTAQQLGDDAAKGLNTGIIYLAFIPLSAIGYIGYRWWKNEKKHNGV